MKDTRSIAAGVGAAVTLVTCKSVVLRVEMLKSR